MKKVFNWCTRNIGLVSILFFTAFIPLYPKLPIINVIRTWVYVRLEDFLVAAAIGIYLLICLKRRTAPKTPLTWPILVYWGVGTISAVFSILFIGPKLEGYFPHLVAFHFLRRIEYMMLFFMAYDVVLKEKSRVNALVWTLAATMLGIIIYGAAQKFLGWPAFLTMNEEFAKGIPLRLPPTARIPSTFGGHYDLAAYIVLTIPILAALVFAVEKLWQKIVLFVLSVGSLVLLLFTASRTSFLVYLIAVSATLWWYKKKWFIVPVILFSFWLLNYVGVATDRFYKTFRFSDIIVDLSTGRPVGTLDKLEGTSAVIKKSESPAEESLPTGSQYIGLPTGQLAQGQAKTIEVYKSVDLATASGEIATISGSFLIQKALVYDISITTRFQGQWPKALEAFKRNIFLGSGYSTLSLAADGDYIRMLGETGVFGTIAFLGIILTAFVLFFRRKEMLRGVPKAYVVGVFGGLTGLLFNGILIDVFEASKVAFSFWLLLGAAMALLAVRTMPIRNYFTLIWKALTSKTAFAFYLFMAGAIVFGSSIPQYFLGDDFTWLKWAAQTPFADIPKLFTDSEGFFYRPIPKLWYMALYAVFWLKPEGYHVMSIMLLGACSYLVFLIMRHTGVRRVFALLASLLFAVLSVHHENVFWISGQSSLLSAAFLFGSIYAYLRHTSRRGLWKTATFIFSLFLMVLSMLSYDGMMVAPIMVSMTAWLASGKKRWTTFIPLLAIPLYWWVRTASGAVPPSGDYGYKLTSLPFNILGNGVGYVVSIFLGPRVTEAMSGLREYLRAHYMIAAGSGVIALAVFSFAAWKIRGQLGAYRNALVWCIGGFVALAAYVGLGGMSERYAFAASGFLVLSTGAFISTLWDNGARTIWKVIGISSIAALIVWNIAEVTRVSRDWKKASETSQHALVTLSKMFFPLKEQKSFVFINTPIRYGRAWIFPTGLTDPLWHVFRLSDWNYTITNVSSPKEAYTLPIPQGYTPEIFIFDDYTLKRIVREVQTVE